MAISESSRPEPPVTDALERVYESSQRLLLKRVDLLVAELRLLAQSALVAVLGALLSLSSVGWVSYGAFKRLDDRMSPEVAAAVIGAVHLLAGIGLILLAHRKLATAGSR